MEMEKTVRDVLEPSLECDLAVSGTTHCPDVKANVNPAAGVVFDDGEEGRLIG
jgi:hypothetical protein